MSDALVGLSSCLIGLTGCHGSGKTTIMNELRKRGYVVDETPSLSRTAQQALGWDNVMRAQDSVLNMWSLQYAILEAMEKRDLGILNGAHCLLVDRTPADLWAYTQLWVHRIGINKVDIDELQKYKEACVRMADLYHHQLYVPLRPEIVFVSESGRADRESQEFHSSSVEFFLWENDFPFSVVETLAPSDRADEVARWLQR